MHRRVVLAAGSLVLSIFLLLPAGAAAQTGSIAGQVADETGGVLPGVTVEASSPALIEGVRTSFSDGSGLYTLEGLRPGTYTVTFVLPGFSTFIREGIEITTGFSANVDATMTVGAVEETVTVSGASPIIDVQNVQHQENISRNTLDTLPTGRTYSGYAALTVGAQTDVLGGGQDVGGSVGDTWGTIIIHGSSTYDGEINWDGMSVTASVTAGGGTGKLYFANQVAVQEVVMSTGGMDAETGFGAVALNYIPKDGGNALSYYTAINGTNENLQWSNFGDELAGRGLNEKQVRGLKKTWDFGGGLGGALVRDKLWFYTAHRWWGTQPYTSLSYPNLAPRLSYGAADYQPDFDNPVVQDNHTRSNNLRLTWQASDRHKLTVSHDNQDHCLCQFWAVFGVVDYLASMDYNYDNISNTQVTWTFPASSRLLFEAGASFTRPSGSPANQPEGLPTDIGVRIFTPSFINLNAQVFSPSTPALYGTNNNFPNFSTKASMSYVTGSHNLKVGLSTRHLQENHPRSYVNNALSYDFSSPNVPLQINQFGTPRNSFQRANILGLFAQDQWTVDRLTLNLGVRYDSLNGFVPAQAHPASRFVPSFAIDRIDNLPNYHDLNARLGAAYDLFGDGRTALKWNMGRYVNAIGTNLAQVNNPMESIILSSSRLWDDANGDLEPNCNLDNFGANGECGAIINPEFGKPIPTTRAREDVIAGWNTRRANWQTSVAVQRELTEGFSVEVAWFRRSNINFTLLDNLNIGPEHFSEFSITAPVDPNLGSVSGQTLGGLYTITPEGAALGTNNLIIPASDYGNPTEIFNGIDVSFQGRLGNGINLGGGVATGAVEINECYVVDDPTQARPGYCNYGPSWGDGTQVKFNGLVPLPYDVDLSFVFQSLPGVIRRSDYRAGADPVERAAIESQIGHDMVTGFEEIPLFPSGIGFYEAQPSSSLPYAGFTFLDNSTQFEPQLYQLDLRLTKSVAIGGGRIRLDFDIFNVFNENAITRILDDYSTGGTYPRPTAVMNGRLIKFGTTIDF